MLKTEKVNYLKKMLNPDTPSDEEIETLLFITKNAILNRRYPQGYDMSMEVPEQYVYIQLQACVQLYNKKGVEGQTSHSENGISRVYEPGDINESLLKKVLPMVCSVSTRPRLLDANIRKK